MHSKPFARYLGGAWRLLLCALLIAALGPVARVRSAGPGGGFTDLGALGLPAVEYGSLAWGDYDSDGDLDVLLEGSTGSGSIASVYRNDGGTFTDAGAGLPAVSHGAAVWGDYDNDGDLDVLLGGSSARTYVLRNDGGTFVDVGAGLLGSARGGAAWGDYDGDGDLDILLAGWDGSLAMAVTRIYRNDGGSFTDVSAGLPGVDYSAVAWGDYDNDGDLDVLLVGSVEGIGAIARIYRNDGGTFVNANAGLVGVSSGAAAWGDYDNDGDLDILLAGSSQARVYRNDGGTFVDINAGLTGVSNAAAAWGDYDNDGDLDLLLSGKAGSKNVTLLYRNDGGSFADSRSRLTDVYNSALAWGDYDNDGDLDIVLAGNAGGTLTTKIFRNGIGAANTPPSAPAGPSAAVDGFAVDLSWGAATDGQTPASGLSYNLRLGTSPGGVDVVSPMADPSSGWRRVPRTGNAGQRTGAHFHLPFGSYYWSVQAVDTAFAGGAFAGEGSFAIQPAAPGQVTVSGPVTAEVGSACVFTATVGPETTALPLTYLWQAGEQQPVSHEGVSALADTVSFIWSTLGTKVVTVTVTNSVGSLSATHNVTVEPLPPFTDLGGLGLQGVERGVAAWGDYDNDGDLDLLQTGVTPAGVNIARVYRNDGGTFVDVSAGLPGITDGTGAWGDYDNDGDLDIAIIGNTGSELIARIYRNDGGTFTNINATLLGGAIPELAWGDYDNDGDLDLLLGGGDRLGFSPHTNLYHNNGDGTFSEVTGTGLPPLSYGDADWADYDSDGDLDLLLVGYTGSVAISRVYRNNGNGTFTNVNAGLPGVLWASAAWGDYDSDGDLDIALMGRLYPSPDGVTEVYRNDGNDAFTDVNAGLPPAGAGVVAWGDYDNDGDLDLLMTCGKGSQLSRNDGNDTFSSVDAGLPPAGYSQAAWGDYDDDGDLDIIVSGWEGTTRVVHVYRNNALSANTVPGVPSGLSATVLGDTAAFSWEPATDAETAAAGLTYNLRVGTTPAGVDVVSPMADVSSGWRRVAALGNANHGTSAWLELPPGTYYWSVQAVDAALAGGAFAPEASVLVPQAPEGASISGRAVGMVDTAHAFTATVTPPGTTLPLTYTWGATGQAPVSHGGVSALTDSVTYTWSLIGSKSVTVTVANQRGQVMATHAIILSQLLADFAAAPLSGVAPFTVAFANLTSGPYSNSEWDFGDGITSTLESPTHTYAIPRAYTVTLTASGDVGSSTMTKPGYITAHEPVQADFIGEPVVGPAPLTVVFANTTTGDYADSEWGFGDGITSTLESPTHTYTIPGVYTVTLSVAGGLGGSDTITKTGYITAATPVQARFYATPAKGVVPLTVELTNTSTGDYSESLWDLGDGITSTLESPTHTYTVGGLYTVTLTVSGAGGIDTRVVPNCITAYPVIPDPGPHRTDIVVQNVGSRATGVKLNLVTGETGGEPQRYQSGSRLAPKGWRRVASGDLLPGVSGVWAGSGTLLSTQPLAALVDMLWDGPLGPKTGASYASQGSPATTAYLPRLAVADGYLTRLAIHNAGAAEAAVGIHFYDRTGTEVLVHNASIPAGAEKTFSLDALAPDLSASNGWGSAYVSADQPVAALATVHTLLSSAAYAGATAGDTTLWAPGVCRVIFLDGSVDYSEVAVQNTAIVTASVHVEFISPGGSLAYAFDDAIAPQATAAYNTYTPGTLDVSTWQDLIAALGHYWRGTVRVTSTGGQPLVGVSVHWAGSTGVADNVAASAVGGGAASGSGLAFPAVYRVVGGGSDERWSVAYVHNTAAVSGTLSVEFYDADGARVGSTYPVEVAANGSVRLHLKAGADLPPAALTDLGEGFTGSMVVTPSPGLEIVGASQAWCPGEERAWGYAGFALP